MAKNQHVVPYVKSDGKKQWAVRSAGAFRVGGIYENKSEAKGIAIQRAKDNRSEVLIHDRYGRIQERNSYGKGSHPPKG